MDGRADIHCWCRRAGNPLAALIYFFLAPLIADQSLGALLAAENRARPAAAAANCDAADSPERERTQFVSSAAGGE